jgi:hypothetical protein
MIVFFWEGKGCGTGVVCWRLLTCTAHARVVAVEVPTESPLHLGGFYCVVLHVWFGKDPRKARDIYMVVFAKEDV